MIPVYQSERVRLYLGDAGVILPSLISEPVEVILTDPPYFFYAHIADEKDDLNIAQEILWMGDVFMLALAWLPMVRALHPAVAWIFFEPHYAGIYLRVAKYLKWPLVGLWPIRGEHEEYLVAFSDTWTLNPGKVDYVRDALRANSYGQAKSVAMLASILDVSPPGMVVDPFCGSGSSVLAALETGRRAIGIETVESIMAPAVTRVIEMEARLTPSTIVEITL